MAAVHDVPGTRCSRVLRSRVRLSASGDRRRAHRALADHHAGQPELRAWHLAAAAAGPDEEAAGLLEQVADQLMRRGDATGYTGGRAELWSAFEAAIGRLAPHIRADLLLLSRTIADPARIAAPVLGELDTAVGSLPEEPDHWRIQTISAAAVYVDRLAGCREALLRVVRDGQAGGAVTTAITALTNLSLDDR